MKKSILIYFLLVFSFLYIHAQEKLLQNDLDKEYTPPPTSLFNSKNSDNNKNFSGVTESKNIVTLSLLTIPRGYTELSYERTLNSRFSLSAGYGYYFMRDYVGELFSDIFDLGNTSNSEMPLATIISSSDLIPKNSYHYAFAVKIFLNKDDYDTRYFLEIKSKFAKIHYKWKYDNDDYSTYSFIGNPDTYLDSKLFSFNWGWQWNSGNEYIKFSQEMILGFGIGKNKYYSYSEKTLDPNYALDKIGSHYYVRNTEKTTSSKITLNIGYKFGIGW